jgi:hypothetical protein
MGALSAPTVSRECGGGFCTSIVLPPNHGSVSQSDICW